MTTPGIRKDVKSTKQTTRIKERIEMYAPLEKELTTQEKIKRLFSALREHQCPMDNRVSIEPCKGFAGRFDPVQGIVLCEPAADETLAHELIHAFDYCTAKFNTLNCDHIACTEVRAARLSGDCDFVTELQRGNFSTSIKDCVKRRAQLSLRLRGCPTQLDHVFEHCFKDQAPFLPGEV